MRLSRLIREHLEISRIETDPLRILPEGTCALDVCLSSCLLSVRRSGEKTEWYNPAALGMPGVNA
jgi:hypothetical protein